MSINFTLLLLSFCAVFAFANALCSDYSKNQASCLKSSEDGVKCSFCSSAAAGTTCMKETDAKTLPSSVFQCAYQSARPATTIKPRKTKDIKWPTPTYQYMTCGTTWTGNVTWTEETLLDYFAVVNASSFTVRATSWGVIPSTDACEAGAYLAFAPIVDNDDAYGPQEKYFLDGDSFTFKVNEVTPPAKQFDFMFFGIGGTVPCNFQLKLKQIDIIC